MRIPRKYSDSFLRKTDEEKRAVARYEGLKNSLHFLPSYYFRDISLQWGIGSPDMPMPAIYVTDERIRDECTQIQNKVLKLLSSYEKA
jgi:hypothetical protein